MNSQQGSLWKSQILRCSLLYMSLPYQDINVNIFQHFLHVEHYIKML